MALAKTRSQRRQELKLLGVRLLTSTLLGAVIVAGFYGYSYLTTTDKLAIETVEINGLNRLSANEMRKDVVDVVGQNILLVPADKYTARFTRHSRVKNVEFRRVLPNRVQFTLEEREPVALIFSGRFVEVDREGVVMETDDLTDFLDLPVITGVDAELVREGQLCTDTRIQAALKTLALCKRYGGDFAGEISELRIDGEGISIVSLQQGVVLVVGANDIESRLKKFFVMRHTIAGKDESAKLIDLRFDGQIVLRTSI